MADRESKDDLERQASSVHEDNKTIQPEPTSTNGGDDEKPATPPRKPAGPPMPPPPVDHGIKCWLQVIASFAMWTNSWGIVNSFGVFQTYYEVTNLGGASPSQISWIGSLQAFLLLFIGELSGPIYDSGYFWLLNLVGSFLVCFGMMMTSICNEYWQVVLAQGLVVGLGAGCLFLPATAIIPQYFVKKRLFASTIAATGSGFGGLIFSIMFREMQSSIGFGWTVRVIAFLVLFFGIVSNAFARNKLPAGKVRKLYDLEAAKNIPLVLFSIGMFFAFIGLYIPAYYIGTYALEQGITGDNMAFYLVAIMQAGSILGRIGPGYAADYTGPMNMTIPAVFISGILALCWIGIHNEAGLIVFALLYGASFGLTVAMGAMCVISLLKGDMRRFGTWLGMMMMILAPGVLIGNPIGGAILRSDGGFTGLQAFAGCMMLVAGVLALISRGMSAGWGKVKF
ncbi:MFS-type transporter dbaD [Pseudocercospora fuligena]|uniref:MFS-type transporter dbaD n=1 Tax=Pseudocercospora fuligena TaxID=685502 RepID=A0A8H6RP62_9PEZI|nr:MFS-type transporter dbaD [Pseudocercospora fuligena]